MDPQTQSLIIYVSLGVLGLWLLFMIYLSFRFTKYPLESSLQGFTSALFLMVTSLFLPDIEADGNLDITTTWVTFYKLVFKYSSTDQRFFVFTMACLVFLIWVCINKIADIRGKQK